MANVGVHFVYSSLYMEYFEKKERPRQTPDLPLKKGALQNTALDSGRVTPPCGQMDRTRSSTAAWQVTSTPGYKRLGSVLPARTFQKIRKNIDREKPRPRARRPATDARPRRNLFQRFREKLPVRTPAESPRGAGRHTI